MQCDRYAVTVLVHILAHHKDFASDRLDSYKQTAKYVERGKPGVDVGVGVGAASKGVSGGYRRMTSGCSRCADTCRYLSFFLDGVLSGTDNFAFLSTVLESVKLAVDATDPTATVPAHPSARCLTVVRAVQLR